MAMPATHHTRGRGSNPISRQNLTGSPKDAYVYQYSSKAGWFRIAGPMTFKKAYVQAERLNKTSLTPIYSATRGTIKEQAPTSPNWENTETSFLCRD